MLGYVPFSRRKVTAVHDPNADAAPGSLESMFWRVDTVAAPWTIEENWRHVQIVEYSDSDDETSSLNTSVEELEKENATIAEPNVLTIFCDLSGFSRPESLVGCGLRGRWALFGTDDGEKWWAFKAKDCELKALVVLCLYRCLARFLAVCRGASWGRAREHVDKFAACEECLCSQRSRKARQEKFKSTGGKGVSATWCQSLMYRRFAQTMHVIACSILLSRLFSCML